MVGTKTVFFYTYLVFFPQFFFFFVKEIVRLCTQNVIVHNCFSFFSRPSTKIKLLCRVHGAHCFLENYLGVILMDTTPTHRYLREYFILAVVIQTMGQLIYPTFITIIFLTHLTRNQNSRIIIVSCRYNGRDSFVSCKTVFQIFIAYVINNKFH